MKITIRELSENDDIQSLIEYSDDCSSVVTGYKSTFKENVDNYLSSSDGKRFVILEDDVIVGISGYKDIFLEIDGELTILPFLTDTLILPSHRGKGYGGTLLNHIINDLRLNGGEILGCSTNTATKYYSERGFVLNENISLDYGSDNLLYQL